MTAARGGACTRAGARLLAALTFCIPALVLLGHKMMVPLLAILTLILLVRRPRRLTETLRHHRSLAIGLAALVMLGIGLVPLSLTPGKSLSLSFSLLLLGVCVLTLLGACIHTRDSRRILWALAAGLALAAVFFLFERLADYPWLRALQAAKEREFSPALYNRGATGAVLFLFPAVACAWREGRHQRIAAVVLAGLVTAQVLLADSAAAQAALAVGVIVSVLVALGGRHLLRALGWLLALTVLASPWLVGLVPKNPESWVVAGRPLPLSWQHRLQIWSFTAERIAERPLVGFGPDTARAMGEYYGDVEILFLTSPDQPPSPQRATPIPLHPHNGALQLWLEYGAGGALLGAWILAILTARIAADPRRWWQALAGGQLAAAVTISMSAYGLWQMAWLAIVAVAATFMVLATQGAGQKPYR